MIQKQIAGVAGRVCGLLVLAAVACLGRWTHERARKAPLARSAEARPHQAVPQSGNRRLAQLVLGRAPLVFERNVGQFTPDVRFLSRGDGCEVALTDDEAILKLSSPPAKAKTDKRAPGAFLRMDLVGARHSVPVAGEKAALTKVNYFVGNDPHKWHTNVRTFGKVRYAGVYPGVDALYYGNHRQLEYDLEVAPRASIKPIRLRFRGAVSARLNARGDLMLRVGGKSVVQHAPVVYQTIGGKRKTVAARYLLLALPAKGSATTEVGFSLGSYDHARPLVIDPTIAYATLFYTEVSSIAADGAGNVYISGNDTPGNYSGQTLPGGAKPTFLHGQSEDVSQIFVAKINANCIAVNFMTFYGSLQDNGGDGSLGTSTREGHAIGLDGQGNIYVVGATTDTDLPTVNGFQSSPGSGHFGNNQDAVLFKLDPTGSKLLYATCLGGMHTGDKDSDGNETVATNAVGALGLVVDPSGNAYIAGTTNALDFPRENAYSTSSGGSGYLSKINTNASGEDSLAFSSVFGSCIPGDVTIDKAGNAYVAGSVSFEVPHEDGVVPQDYIPIVNPLPGSRTNFPPDYNKDGTIYRLGHYGGGFVTKFSPAGSVVFSTLDVGGFGSCLAHDNANGLYVIWEVYGTEEENLGGAPTQLGSKQEQVAKINDDASGVVYETFFGGVPSGRGGDFEYAHNAVVDSQRRLIITGITTSTAFPQVDPLPSPFSDIPAGQSSITFLVQLSADGHSFVFSTQYGSTGQGEGVAVDPSDNIYVVGQSDGTGVPTQDGLPIQNGIGFVLKLGAAANNAVNSTADRDDVNPGDGACYTGQNTSTGAPECTLRAAIEEANASKDAAPYPITFNIPGAAVPSIAPLKPLPIISHPVKLDGTTQPGGMLVELSGASAGTASGLTINAGGSTVQGMVINRFQTDGVLLLNRGGNTIQGCLIGLDVTGKITRGNGQSGVHALKSPNNLIGGMVATARNIISGTRVAATSGDSGYGVWIDAGSANNQVQGNFIGTDKSGSKAVPNGIGVLVGSDVLAKSPAALSALVGGNSTKPGTAPGNVISGNSNVGVLIGYSSRSVVAGNLIGTSVGGTTGVPNGYAGVRVFRASQNTIGGTQVGALNVVSGNTKDGIQIFGIEATRNTVAGNFVGTKISGTSSLGNGLVGVHLLGCSSNTVGGTSVAARNIISGNAKGYGVWIQSSNTSQTGGGTATDNATGNTVVGDFIGLNVSGAGALPNGFGLVVDANGKNSLSASKNTVTNNTVSGNTSVGVGIVGFASRNTIQNNFIGTSSMGSSPVGNGAYGVVLQQASLNTIAGNTVSGNGRAGVVLVGTYPAGYGIPGFPVPATTDSSFSENVLKSNFIGTTPGGLRALPNGARAPGGTGILILPGGGNGTGINFIGVPGAGNVVSGNVGAGIAFLGGTNNAVQGNLIGVSGNGVAALPNSGAGISMVCNTNNIGGLGASQGNTIAYNGGAGVAVVAGSDNAILSNAIYANKHLGIDLGGDGKVNPLLALSNQGTNAGGPNHSQNFPQIASIIRSGSGAIIGGTLQSAPKTEFVIQFFANTLRDPSGYGQGQRFLGNVNTSTDGSGLAKFSFRYTGALGLTEAISMTATGDKDDLSTSEFSALPLSISGGVYHYITDPNNPKATIKRGVPGVLLQRLDNGSVAAQENTGTDGLYAFSASPRGEFTLVPSLQGPGFAFEFEPTLRLVKLPSSAASKDATGVDFVFYSLGGTVVNSLGKPVIGATVTLSGTTPDTDGTLTRTLKTNTQGQFLFDGLTRGTYKVAASGDVPSVASTTLPSTGLAGISPNGQINLAPPAPPKSDAPKPMLGSGGSS